VDGTPHRVLVRLVSEPKEALLSFLPRLAEPSLLLSFAGLPLLLNRAPLSPFRCSGEGDQLTEPTPLDLPPSRLSPLLRSTSLLLFLLHPTRINTSFSADYRLPSCGSLFRFILGFEEPDCAPGSGSAGMDVDSAARLWNSLVAPLGEKGSVLFSPSMCRTSRPCFPFVSQLQIRKCG
jgi:hypothetical protein